SSFRLPCFSNVFFFQAEDGLRYGHVTGVQTCALPISQRTLHSRLWSGKSRTVPTQPRAHPSRCQKQKTDQAGCRAENARRGSRRSEERRVGKEVRSLGGRHQYK